MAKHKYEEFLKNANLFSFENNNNLDNFYNKDDEELFKSYLFNRIFIRNKNNEEIKFPSSRSALELIIRPECNQKCDYCYIYKYGDELYPKEERVDNQTILNNLKILLNYFYENHIYINDWDIFAGDLFYDNLWFDLMDIFYDYFKKLYKNYPKIWEQLEKEKERFILSIPNNFSFCHNKEKIKKVQEYIDKFKAIKVIIHMSYSHDGYYSMDIREKKKLTEEYYDDVFNFIKYNHHGCHPMISYEGIENSIQNYEWWKKQHEKYKLHGYLPMFLEVRNDGWTNEKIQKYLELLDYMIEDRLKMCNNNLEEFTSIVMRLRNHEFNRNLPILTCNDLIELHFESKENTRENCTMGHGVSIKLNNLSIVPCHRMAYPHFEAGYFEVYNNTIQDIKIKNNVDAYYNMTNQNVLMRVKCAKCDYRFVCMKGCIGSQYETYGDYNIPVESVCNLLKAKYDFLFNKYHKMGVFKKYFEIMNTCDFYKKRKNKNSTYYRLKEMLEIKGWTEAYAEY